MKSKRKLLSLILALSMAIGSFTALPMAASADEDAENPTVSLMTDESGESTDGESGESTEGETEEDESGETEEGESGETATYTTLYSQDYEAVTADTIGDYWKSDHYADGISLGTDNSKYAQYTCGSQNTRSAYSEFTVDVSSYNEYIMEFDLALTKSTKDGDVVFAVSTGSSHPTNEGVTSNYLFKVTMQAVTNDCYFNDIDTTTATYTDSAWYHYVIYADRTRSLASVTITDSTGAAVLKQAIVPMNGNIDSITGVDFCSGRHYSVMKLDNILVRTTTDDDDFGEPSEETLSKVVFTSELNQKISQPEDAVHYPITIKASGIYGSDLTSVEGLTVDWSVVGLDGSGDETGEDGYISLTAAKGTGYGTDGYDPTDTDTTVYFNVRNGVSNWFGKVVAKVIYLEKTIEISTPFAVIGASGSGGNIAPEAGYPEDMSDYATALVGYTATANTITGQDLVLNNWSIYGSNNSRTLTLEKDDDGTKYLRFASNGGSGSTVGVYQLANQSSQYIVDMTVRFTGTSMAFGHYITTPNNTSNDPSWTASYASGTLTVGTESISGLNSDDWFRIVVSADESTDTLWVQVYDEEGTLVGETETELLDTASSDQKYFCFQGTYPVDLAKFKIYTPTAAAITVNSDTDTISVPTGVAATDVDLDDDGILSYSTETKALTVSLADAETADLITAEYTDGVISGVEVTPLTFTEGVATVENYEVSETAKVYLWDSLDGMEPLTSVGVYEEPSSEESITAELAAIVTDLNGFDVTGEVTWEIDTDDETIVLGVTDSQNATLTVSKGAPAGAVTITARCGTVSVDKTIMLTTTGNSINFAKSTSSMTIPFSGEDAVTAEFEAYTVNKSGNKTEYAVDDDGNATETPTTITYTVLDKNSSDITDNMPTGVTFADGVLTVTSEAKSNVIYIKATNNDVTPLSRTVKVTIHGLSFAFGSDEPADTSYTQVTTDSYSEKLGYGFADASVVTASSNSVTGSNDYRFKVTVPNGNYTVSVDTTSDSITSEVVESVTATTGISKSGTSFDVAVCDGVLDLTFASDSTLSSVSITQKDAKTPNSKPAVYAIGDSTTSNNSSGACSWGNCVVNGDVTIPSGISAFYNHGMAGRDSVNYYNQGRVESVLLNVCPGDYVTVNMGINSKETNEGSAYYTLLSQYYVQAIIERDAIPVIVTATAQGPVNGHEGNYNSTTGVFTCNRGTDARNGVLRQIAQEKELNIIELGYWCDDLFNSLDLDTYNAANEISYTSVLEIVQSWYVDHNHYTAKLGTQIGKYLLDSVADIIDGSTDFLYSNDTHIEEQ